MLRWIGNIFFAFLIGTLGTYLLWALIVGEFPVGGSAFLLLFAAGLAMIAWASGLTRLNTYKNREHAGLILAYLEQAIRLNLPLPQMLVAAEASEGGSLALKIHQLLARLDTGQSITEAVEKSVPGTPLRTLGLLGAAERVGRIGPELNRLVCDERRPRERSISERSFINSYPFAMVVVIVFVLGMLMTYVMPKYERIFRDFHAPMPPITLNVIGFLHLLGDNGWLQLAIELTAAMAIIQRIRLSAGLWKPAIWCTTSRQYGDVCHVIAESMDAGMPLDSALRAAGELAISKSLRRKLRQWADAIEQGVPSAQAAGDAGMPKLIVGLTSTTESGPATEAFRFLSRYYAAKFSRLMTVIRAAAVPGMVFFFGVIVAVVALAMFMPIVAMIDSLSHTGGSL